MFMIATWSRTINTSFSSKLKNVPNWLEFNRVKTGLREKLQNEVMSNGACSDLGKPFWPNVTKHSSLLDPFVSCEEF